MSRAPPSVGAPLRATAGTRHEPFNFTPMGVNSISSGSPRVRRMGGHRTCGEPNEMKKNTHSKNSTALLGVRRHIGSRGDCKLEPVTFQTLEPQDLWFFIDRRWCADANVAGITTWNAASTTHTVAKRLGSGGGWEFLHFVRSSTCTPHGGASYAQGSKRH